MNAPVTMSGSTQVDPAVKGTRQDPYYALASEVVLKAGRGSISTVQRHLRLGYNHAAQLLESMEGDILGPQGSNGIRPLLENAHLSREEPHA